VCLLNKSLYGLTTVFQTVIQTFDSFMVKTRYNRCEYENCVYFKQEDDLTYLMLYVDDMLIAARNKTYYQKLKTQLKKKFDTKDLGEAKNIISMEIT